MPGKSLLTSNTFWVNALTLALAFGGHLAGVLPEQAQPYIAAGLAIGNIVLRLITSQPIKSIV